MEEYNLVEFNSHRMVASVTLFLIDAKFNSIHLV